ncbi:MAG: peptidoglycan-binding domain-containing protein [Pyrinomonadaceae bacterium]
MRHSLIVIFTIILLSISLYGQPANTAGNSSKASEATGAKTRQKAFRPTKAQIIEAQEKLKAAGTYAGEADGKYNDDFRAALREFQEKNSLEQTGRLDEATLGKMGIALTDRQKGIEPAASDKPKRVVFRPTKEQISAAQRILKQNGSFQGEETGRYSNELRAAIRDYQSANGLKRKGSLNRATLEKMGIELTEDQAAIPVNPNDLASADDAGGAPKKRGPVFRATKAQITEVQNKLKAEGLYAGESDGKFNDDFRAAIRKWQEANGVKSTGTLNKMTLEAMKIELTDRQKEM